MFDQLGDGDGDGDDLERDIFNNFSTFEADILNEMKLADKIPGPLTDDDLSAEIEIKQKDAPASTNMADLDKFNTMFDNLEEEDDSEVAINGSSLVDDFALNEITQSIDDIANDFPGVIVKHDNFMMEALDEEEEKEPEVQEITEVAEVVEEIEEIMHPFEVPISSAQRSLAKSMVIKSTSKDN